MITVTHLQGVKPLVVNDDGNRMLGETYFRGSSKPNYPMPATTQTNWSDWYSNQDGYWNCPIDERLWRLERTLWANGY